MMMASGMFVATSCSDFSDYNTAPVSTDATAENTLWENISGNANLSDFASVLKRVGYDEKLNTSHTYTVWAPVNGSFNMDSLAALSDSKVQKEFVENLIADYAHIESDVNDTTIYMLNEKLLKFRNKNTGALTFDSKAILANANNASIFNYPSTNGLLYTVVNPATFRYNAYEIIDESADVASTFDTFVKKYEQKILDTEKSVKGEIINGQQHYDDSVIVTSNTFTERTLGALLDNEDSLYTILIPNDQAWEKAYNNITKYYKYIPTLNYQDLSNTAVGATKGGAVQGSRLPQTATGATFTLGATVGSTATTLASAPSDSQFETTQAYWTDSISKRYITNYLAFSETDKKYNSKLVSGEAFVKGDTLYTTRDNKISNPADIAAATEKIIELSNGHARILNDYPFLAKETYLPTIKTRNVARSIVSNTSTNAYTTVNVRNYEGLVKLDDDDTEFRYVKADISSTSSYAPEMDFYIPNVRSATYDVYLVTVPGWWGEEDSLDHKPYCLRVDLNYTDASNTLHNARFNGDTIVESGIKNVKTFIVGQEKVDTVKLGRVTFPVCYVNTEAKPNIKVMHVFSSFNASRKKTYEQELRIANVILRPVYDEDDNATKE